MDKNLTTLELPYRSRSGYWFLGAALFGLAGFAGLASVESCRGYFLYSLILAMSGVSIFWAIRPQHTTYCLSVHGSMLRISGDPILTKTGGNRIIDMGNLEAVGWTYHQGYDSLDMRTYVTCKPTGSEERHLLLELEEHAEKTSVPAEQVISFLLQHAPHLAKDDKSPSYNLKWYKPPPSHAARNSAEKDATEEARNTKHE